jgi:hypothetical protein
MTHADDPSGAGLAEAARRERGPVVAPAPAARSWVSIVFVLPVDTDAAQLVANEIGEYVVSAHEAGPLVTATVTRLDP